jgi:hypothetical protein
VTLDMTQYNQAEGSDLAYIAANKPDAGFIQRAVSQAATVASTLDKDVPGWSVLLDIASPVLPGAGLIADALTSVAGSAVSQAVTNTTPLLGGGGGLMPTQLGTLQPLDITGQTATASQGLVGAALQPIVEPLQTVSSATGAVKFQLTKSTAQAAAAGDGVLDALESISEDLLNGYSLAASLIAAFGVTGAAFLALQAGISALKAVVTVVNAVQAENALEAAANQAKANALTQEVQQNSQIAALQAQLAALEGQLVSLGTSATGVLSGVASSPLGQAAVLVGAAWFLAEVFG